MKESYYKDYTSNLILLGTIEKDKERQQIYSIGMGEDFFNKGIKSSLEHIRG